VQQRLCLLLLGVWLVLAVQTGNAVAAPIALGQSAVALNAPWKFHTGDNPRWADDVFDDSKWETVDLTPPPGAHDGDVGLSGYVPGWSMRGHRGYSGYAWYRMHVSVTAPAGETLALTGPTDVDNVYQIFFNGTLLGSDGDFSHARPAIYSIQPRNYLLPSSLWKREPSGAYSGVVALRVWMGAAGAAAPDSGGIHIAPALGNVDGVSARYRLQWLQTFEGYVVDATEAILFLLVAVMALSVRPFDGKDSFYAWLSVALILLAAARGNQAIYFWTQIESLRQFALFRLVLVDSLVLGAWLTAWRAYFLPGRHRGIATVIALVTFTFVIAQLFSYSTIWPALPHGVIVVSHTVATYIRYLFILLLAYITGRGIVERGREIWIALPAVVLVSTGLFAQELSALGVPGIWFPFGVGVSRTEYAYAGLVVALFVLLLHRLMAFARDREILRKLVTA
jgi:hypothetical protein